MHIEYFINSIDTKETEIKDTIDSISKSSINAICGIYPHIKYIKKNYPKITVGTMIDYPLGYMDNNRRQDCIADAINIGSNVINITVPFHDIINRRYSKFKDDIEKNVTLCLNNNVKIRYVLEYRKFDHSLLAKVCGILMQYGVDTVYPSSGFFLDSIEDNIIACAYLHEKTGINTIVNGNIWTKNHFGSILKINPFGCSISNPIGLTFIS
jgi:deoxyribose-phosphate aldolase